MNSNPAAVPSPAPLPPPAPWLWLDGELRAAAETGGSLFAHALHYGTGVFEGIRVYPTARGAAIFRLEDHLARLKRGAAHLGMAVDERALAAASLAVLRANRHESAYLRPLVFLGAGGLGLDVGAQRTHALVASLPWRNHLGEAGERGVRLRTSPLRRVSSGAVPPLKFCGLYVNSVLAKREAALGGWDEALFIDARGGVCEATGENVFLVKDGRVTAVAHPDALPGITRDTVIALAGAESRAVRAGELREADEVFLTGTSAEIAAVAALDDRIYGANPVTRALQREYSEIVRGRTAARSGWLTPV